MENQVQEILRHFGGRLCCYACVIEFVDPAGVEFLKHLLEKKLTVKQITRDPVLFRYLHTFGRQTSENLLSCRRALVESNQPNESEVIHRGYYQQQILTVSYRFCGLQIQMGELRKGQVLEIFRWDNNCDITANILATLKNDFSETIDRSVPFRNLPNVKFDQYYHFNYKTGVRCVGSPEYKKRFSSATTPSNWASSSMLDQYSALCSSLRSTERGTLFIFEGISNPKGMITTISTWVQVIERIFGDTSKVFIVFVVDYTSFSKPQTADKLAARRLANIFNTPELNAKITWLDTTSTKWSDICAPEYGEHPEAGKEMNLNLRRFEDGCV